MVKYLGVLKQVNHIMVYHVITWYNMVYFYKCAYGRYMRRSLAALCGRFHGSVRLLASPCCSKMIFCGITRG